MNRLFALLSYLALTLTAAYAGSEYGSKSTAVSQPCPAWYANTEWNVGVWGTYAFTGEQYRDDRYIESDHAWGGGLDAKYFFHRYFGVGIEGYVLDATRTQTSLLRLGDVGGNSRAIGSILGTFTLRYPLGCSRFSPYIFAGGGAIFGGGESDRLGVVGRGTDAFGEPFKIIGIIHEGSRSEAIGQVGGGLEVRLTPHIGLISDFSWNVIDGPSNNFGLVRTGISFAF